MKLAAKHLRKVISNLNLYFIRLLEVASILYTIRLEYIIFIMNEKNAKFLVQIL